MPTLFSHPDDVNRLMLSFLSAEALAKIAPVSRTANRLTCNIQLWSQQLAYLGVPSTTRNALIQLIDNGTLK